MPHQCEPQRKAENSQPISQYTRGRVAHGARRHLPPRMAFSGPSLSRSGAACQLQSLFDEGTVGRAVLEQRCTGGGGGPPNPPSSSDVQLNMGNCGAIQSNFGGLQPPQGSAGCFCSDVRWCGVALLSVCCRINGRFSPVKRAMSTARVEAMVAAIMCFRRTDAFHGKRKAEAYNEAQKAAALTQKPVLASQHRALCSAARWGTEDGWRVLWYHLHSIHFSVGYPSRKGVPANPPPPPDCCPSLRGTQGSETGTVRGLRWHDLPREREGV